MLSGYAGTTAQVVRLAPHLKVGTPEGHWGIENRLHWVLDVTCHEDQARNRKGHCAENLALLRKLALNLARLEASKGSMRGKLKRAGWDDGYLISILSQFTKIHMR